ncbi:MAG: hypothetical protein JXQ71_06060 [Verrucomicrobia bacterium]|nr:hypothetical protein [Verrucomicrobiota bacterium]
MGAPLRGTTRRREAGSAVLVVFTVLAVMGTLIVCNNRILHALHQELRLLEQRQQQKFTSAAPFSRPAPQRHADQTSKLGGRQGSAERRFAAFNTAPRVHNQVEALHEQPPGSHSRH